MAQLRMAPNLGERDSSPRESPLGTQKKGHTVEEAYEEIKRMIYYNLLAPGQKLVYQDLAKRLNMSITPVIQALNGLKRSNFVRYEPNKGYFVGEITETEARELYQTREALETYLVPFVIENLKPNDHRELHSALRAFREPPGASQPGYQRFYMIKDAEFHLRIVEYAQNRTIYKLLKEVFENIYLRYRPEYLSEERVERAASEHRAILSALGKGDVEETTNLLRKHIENGMNHVIEYIRSRNRALI